MHVSCKHAGWLPGHGRIPVRSQVAAQAGTCHRTWIRRRGASANQACPDSPIFYQSNRQGWNSILPQSSLGNLRSDLLAIPCSSKFPSIALRVVTYHIIYELSCRFGREESGPPEKKPINSPAAFGSKLIIRNNNKKNIYM